MPKVNISAKFQLLKAILNQDIALFQFLGVDHFSGRNPAGTPENHSILIFLSKTDHLKKWFHKL